MLKMLGLSQWVFIFLVCIIGLTCAMFLMFAMMQSLIDRVKREQDVRYTKINKLHNEINELKAHIEIVDAKNVNMRTDLMALFDVDSYVKACQDLGKRIDAVSDRVDDLDAHVHKDEITWETPIEKLNGIIDGDKLHQQMRDAGDSVAVMGNEMIVDKVGREVAMTPVEAKDIVNRIQNTIKKDGISEFVKELK